jgi:hypothetical protein
MQGCPALMDAEVCPSLQTAMRNYFMMLEVLNSMTRGPKCAVAHFARRWAQVAKQKGTSASQQVAPYPGSSSNISLLMSIFPITGLNL